MLKLMFTGSAIVGFALAAFLGFGYNPMEASPFGGGSSASAAAAPAERAQPKPAIGSDKPATSAPAAASSPIAAAASAFDPAQIASALESITGGSAETQPTVEGDSASTTPSTQDLMNMFTELTGIKTDGNSLGGGDFSLDSVLKMLGGGR